MTALMLRITESELIADKRKQMETMQLLLARIDESHRVVEVIDAELARRKASREASV